MPMSFVHCSEGAGTDSGPYQDFLRLDILVREKTVRKLFHTFQLTRILTQFSSLCLLSLGERRFLLLSSAERARCRLTCFNVFVGEAWVEWECSWFDWVWNKCVNFGFTLENTHHGKLKEEDTWNGLMLWRILWSVAVGGRNTLLMHTFGAELDLSWELRVLGCLKVVDWVLLNDFKARNLTHLPWNTLTPVLMMPAWLSGFASNSW